MIFFYCTYILDLYRLPGVAEGGVIQPMVCMQGLRAAWFRGFPHLSIIAVLAGWLCSTCSL
jgi:hypothetical protein